MQTIHLAKTKFHEHWQNAKRRGIVFSFTFKEWVSWWESHLGSNWLDKRGRKRTQYCMARFEDRGPYKSSNVKCILNIYNHKERIPDSGPRERAKGINNVKAKLTNKDVELIKKEFTKGIKVKDLAAKYKVNRVTIYRITQNKGWKHLSP